MDKYLIGAFSDGKQAQRYLDSLKVIDGVEPIFIQYLNKGDFDHIDKPSHVKLIKYAKQYPGNTGKHKDFREILSPILERDTWVIFTDMHDVVFQAPLPEFPEGEILVASEGVNFGEIDYWAGLFPQEMMSLEAYNVGTFAMKRDVLIKFWDYLYENWMDFYSWYKTSRIPQIGNGETFPFNIPFHERVRVEMAIMFNNHYDTLCFNKFLRKRLYTEVPGLFACFSYQVKKGKVELHQDKLYIKKKLASVAHYNGSAKKYLKGGIKHDADGTN